LPLRYHREWPDNNRVGGKARWELGGVHVEAFIRYFVRINAGKWTCVRNGEFDGPNGRIQVTVGSTFVRGTNFMGIDLAQWLDEEYEKIQPRPHFVSNDRHATG